MIEYNKWIEEDCSDFCDGSLIQCTYSFDDKNNIEYWQNYSEYGESNEAVIYCILSTYFTLDGETDYEYEDLDYELYVEWFDNKNSTKELTTAIDNFRNNCIKKWNKLKDENKWIEGENEYERL